MAHGGDLVRRLLTLGVLVPALLAAVFLDPTIWGTLAIATAAGVIALDELVRMVLGPTAADRTLRVIVAAYGAALIAAPTLMWTLAANPSLPIQPMLLAAAVLTVGLRVLADRDARDAAPQRFATALAGLTYIPLLMSVLPRLKAEHPEHGAAWLFLALAIPFVADGFAYIFGRLFGRHKLAPAISPGKTWEGAAGGLAASIAAALAIRAAWLSRDLGVVDTVVVASLASVAGQCGDLFESALKRAVGVKDSGQLLPGHGGMLDRIDALLFAAPVVYYYLAIVIPAGSAGPAR